MPAQLLDGKRVAEALRVTLKTEITAEVSRKGRSPGLVLALIGEHPPSQIYVKSKIKSAEAVGIVCHPYYFPASLSEDALLRAIAEWNADSTIDGILIQLPLPTHIQTARIIEAIHPQKDVDGFHPENMGRLTTNLPGLRPCTPYGVMRLLDAYALSVQAAHAVIVGASNIVGRPMALELLNANATVTLCHRQTTHLQRHIQMADYIIVATGCYNVVPAEWLMPHHVVIDVGTHRDTQGKIHGDMDFNAAQERVAYITPVPYGIGPMTVWSLQHNTLQAFKNA